MIGFNDFGCFLLSLYPEVLSYYFLIYLQYNATVLHVAALKGHLNVIEFVLNETNFNKISHKNTYDKTALYLAAEKGHLDILYFLYSKGADVNVVTNVSFFNFFL